MWNSLGNYNIGLTYVKLTFRHRILWCMGPAFRYYCVEPTFRNYNMRPTLDIMRGTALEIM